MDAYEHAFEEAKSAAPGRHPDLRPPEGEHGVLQWLRKNLFASGTDTLVTVMCLLFIWFAIVPAIQWLIIDASWAGSSRADCEPGGACWVFVRIRFDQFVYGFYPIDERWRVNLGFVLLAMLMALLFLPGVPQKRRIGFGILLIYPIIAWWLFYGGRLGLEVVDTPKWGGILVTLVLAGVGMVVSLPLGVVLALGRRSHMPTVRSVCVAYIEFIRGVPLITILFMASVVLPLFFHEGVSFDKLARAMIGVSLFWAAYMAEAVRGGLQAIPKGQYEAAQSMGLGYWRVMALVVLPQALKHAIPGIVNTFISLFKDTTLVSIIGMFDLLGIVQAAASHPQWLGYYKEGYIFAAVFYFLFCFSMSQYSQHLERKLETGY